MYVCHTLSLVNGCQQVYIKITISGLKSDKTTQIRIIPPKLEWLDSMRPSPRFTSIFLLRSRNYLKEHPPTQHKHSASIANGELLLSDKLEDVVRLVYTHYKQ